MTEIEDQRDWYADECDRLVALLAEIANSGAADVDPRQDWIEVQVDREVWAALGEFRREPA